MFDCGLGNYTVSKIAAALLVEIGFDFYSSGRVEFFLVGVF
jgi:hypothetical protein